MADTHVPVDDDFQLLDDLRGRLHRQLTDFYLNPSYHPDDMPCIRRIFYDAARLIVENLEAIKETRLLDLEITILTREALTRLYGIWLSLEQNINTYTVNPKLFLQDHPDVQKITLTLAQTRNIRP